MRLVVGPLTGISSSLPIGLAPPSTVEKRSDPLGRILVLPRRSPVTTRFYGVNYPQVKAPAGYVQIYANRSWRVVARPGCVAS